MHVHVPKVGCCVHGVHGLLRVVLLCLRRAGRLQGLPATVPIVYQGLQQ